MNKFSRILPLFFLIIVSCNAQNKELTDFIPKGYVAFQKYFGDLNKDGQDDCVLIIKRTDKNNVVINRFEEKIDRNRRGIIVLLKNGDGYQLADKNYDCFSSENEDGGVYFPPNLRIIIQRGNLIVHYDHGRYGFWKYTFRFQNSNFKLIEYHSESYNNLIINKTTNINFLTKKKLIKENTNEDAEGNDEIFKETWNNIEIKNLIKLSGIKDFDELDMHIY